jgi:serine/threonine protein phosphatase PrpC
MAKNFFGITDTGRLRHNNEDTFIAQAVLNNKYIAACVIDGVGGYSGGEVAAKLAQEAILETLRSTPGDLLTLMRQGLATANERIYNEKQRNK